MKGFFDYLKGIAVQMAINALKENTDKFAKVLADKADIPFLNEKQEKELAEKLIDGISELLEEVMNNPEKKSK